MIVVNLVNNSVIGYNNVRLVEIDGEQLYEVSNDDPYIFCYVEPSNLVGVYDETINDGYKSWLYINGELIPVGSTQSL